MADSDSIPAAIRPHLAIMDGLLACRHFEDETGYGSIAAALEALVSDRDRFHLYAPRELAVELNDAPLAAPPALAAAFALMLRQRGLESVSLHPSVPEAELRRLVAFLRTGEDDGAPHPHFRCEPAAEGPAPAAAETLSACLADAGHAARLDALPAPARDAMLLDYLARDEWLALAPLDVPRAFATMLDLLEGGGADLSELAPPELLHVEAPAPDKRAIDDLALALREHDADDTALLILCEILSAAESQEEYRQRRKVFLAAFRQGCYSSRAVARIQRYIAAELPALAFENRDDLVAAVFDATTDEEAVTLFLGSMSDRPNVVRPLLNRFIVRADPFTLLVRLLRVGFLKAFRGVLTEKLLEAARAKPEALRLWARQNRDAFFEDCVFNPLFGRGTEIMGAICKEILLEGPDEDRARLIARLRADDSETALRLLVLGMTYGDEPCDTELVEALARFEHPLAVAALQDIVHRSNTGILRTEEAEAALRAIGATGTEEGTRFLREVKQRRTGMLPMFRKPLRRAAARVLEERAR